MSMKSKVILITGATAGFGEACARRYSAEGARVILCGRRQARLEALQQELGTQRTHTLHLDVQDNNAVQNAVASLPAEFSQIDILVNNAGLALGLAPAHQTEMSDWEQMVDTNIKGVMYCTRAILPGMIKRNRGHIVNMGSVAAHYPYPGGNVYAATKAFINQFSLSLRADLQGSAVRVTTIEPGLAETEFSLVRFKGDPSRADSVYQGTKPLDATDIAEAVFWTTSLPAHVNINVVEMMPVCQSFNPLHISRE